MTSKERYDPEDLEQLMRERQYDQLLEEEKTYVLRHMSGPEEYEQVRATLLAISAHMDKSVDIEPDPAIKSTLMAEFAKEERKGFTYWLNSIGMFLLPPDRAFYSKPGLQLAFTTALVLIGFFFFYNAPEVTDTLAHTEEKEDVDQIPLEREKEVAEEDGIETDGDVAPVEGSLDKLLIEEDVAEYKQLENQEPIVLADDMVVEDDIDEFDTDVPTITHDLPSEPAPATAAKKESLAESNEMAEEEQRFRSENSSRNEDTRLREAENKGLSAAGATDQQITTIDAATPEGFMSIDDSSVNTYGNAVDMNVSNEMLYSKNELEEITIAKAGKAKDNATKYSAKVPLKSANMRQYNDLVGLLHTTL